MADQSARILDRRHSNRVLSRHPDVAMVAAGRRPVSVKGEITVAYVVMRAGLSVRSSSEPETSASTSLHLRQSKCRSDVIEAVPEEGPTDGVG
ncbi:hypothetical protein [Gordonia sp. i37]|uniref:AMP-binding enzyme n=1 Tax=Gordonia sp. i37 TaxID=1961707 RepID=UPI00345247FB